MFLTMQILANKLNLWEIPDEFGKHGGEIAGIRFFDYSVTAFSQDHLYIGNASEYFFSAIYQDAVLLAHKSDLLVVYGKTVEEISNEVFSIFEYYNTWEKALEDAVKERNKLKAILDLSVPIFGGIILIAEEDGHVLAYTEICKNDSPWYVEIKETGIVPLNISNGIIKTIDGRRLTDWSGEPKLYKHELGFIFIAFYKKISNNPPLLIIIVEDALNLTTAHCHLAAFLGGFIQKTLIESHSDILDNFEIIATDIINGLKIDDAVIPNIKIPKPWHLITIRNISAPDNHPRQKKLLRLIKNMKVTTISFLYQNDLLVIIKKEMAEPFLTELLKLLEKRYYTLGVSLPFSQEHSLRNAYFQCAAAIEESAGQINSAAELAFRIVLKQIKKMNQDYGFSHPALGTLKSWDHQYNTKLYETLYHFLVNDRNIKDAAESLGIHRNTLSYRLTQIKDITGIDLDIREERYFAIMSFLLAND
jgi:hypothetical protein